LGVMINGDEYLNSEDPCSIDWVWH
jgi:hypothetical protein